MAAGGRGASDHLEQWRCLHSGDKCPPSMLCSIRPSGFSRIIFHPFPRLGSTIARTRPTITTTRQYLSRTGGIGQVAEARRIPCAKRPLGVAPQHQSELGRQLNMEGQVPPEAIARGNQRFSPLIRWRQTDATNAGQCDFTPHAWAAAHAVDGRFLRS